MVRGRRNPAYYALPDRLRQARKRKGLSMSAASLTIGGSSAAAFLIEHRQALPRLDTIEEFALSLGVSPAWLAYGEGPADDVPTEAHAGTIGQRLESARKERGLSRQALGNLSGLTGQTVANIEVKGMIPRVDTAEMLARALGVTAGWLGYKLRTAAKEMPHQTTAHRHS